MALGRRLLQQGVWAVKRIAQALGISRPHLSANRQERASSTPRASYVKDDNVLLERIRALVSERPTYGYRRVTALLNRQGNEPRVNHKRVYRVMKASGLLLAKYTGGIERRHIGEVITLKSNLCWCSDGVAIRC